MYFLLKYVRNTYEYVCTPKNTYVPCRNLVGQTRPYLYVFVRIRTYLRTYRVRIAYVFVRIRTYRTYPFVLFHARTLLVSVLRHLLCRGLSGLCIHDAEAIRCRVPVRQVSLAFDVL